jgi:hypothetical protein
MKLEWMLPSHTTWLSLRDLHHLLQHLRCIEEHIKQLHHFAILHSLASKQTKHIDAKLKKMSFAPKPLWSFHSWFLHHRNVYSFPLVIFSFVFSSIRLDFHLHEPIPTSKKNSHHSTSQCISTICNITHPPFWYQSCESLSLPA